MQKLWCNVLFTSLKLRNNFFTLRETWIKMGFFFALKLQCHYSWFLFSFPLTSEYLTFRCTVSLMASEKMQIMNSSLYSSRFQARGSTKKHFWERAGVFLEPNWIWVKPRSVELTSSDVSGHQISRECLLKQTDWVHPQGSWFSSLRVKPKIYMSSNFPDDANPGTTHWESSSRASYPKG